MSDTTESPLSLSGDTSPTETDNNVKCDVKITVDDTEDDSTSIYTSTKEELSEIKPEFSIDKLPETIVLLRSPEGAKVYIVGMYFLKYYTGLKPGYQN